MLYAADHAVISLQAAAATYRRRKTATLPLPLSSNGQLDGGIFRATSIGYHDHPASGRNNYLAASPPASLVPKELAEKDRLRVMPAGSQ